MCVSGMHAGAYGGQRQLVPRKLELVAITQFGAETWAPVPCNLSSLQSNKILNFLGGWWRFVLGMKLKTPWTPSKYSMVTNFQLEIL